MAIRRYKNYRTIKLNQAVKKILFLVLGIFVLFIAYKTYAAYTDTKPIAATDNKNVSNIIKVESVKPTVTEVQTAPYEEITIGKSVKGRLISGYVFGKGEDTTLMFGAIHGNEMGTADLMNDLIDYLKNNPSAVGSGKQLVIIPILNPDGYYDRTDKLNADGGNIIC